MCSEAPQFQRAKCSSVASWILHHLFVAAPRRKTLAGFPSLFMSWWSPRIVTFWMSYTKRHGKSAGAGWAAGGWCFFRDFLLGKRRQVNLESIFFSPSKSNYVEGGFAGGSQSHLWGVGLWLWAMGTHVQCCGLKSDSKETVFLTGFHSFCSAWIEAPVDSCVYKHIVI